MRKLLSHFLCLVVLQSCATGLRMQQTKVLEEFKQQDFSDGLSVLEESEIKLEKKHQLLYLMEKGTLLFYKKDYRRAARVFNEANDLVDKLYTKSIREAITSSIVNDNSKTFHGSIFERSLLFYYQAMSFYELSKQGRYIDSKGVEVKLTSIERDGYLSSSRSTLLAWDTFFKDLKRSSNFKSILQADLLSKSLAAKLHEQMGSREDLEIALQLYKDALDISTRFGPAYSVFNENYLTYNKELAAVLKGNEKASVLKKQEIKKTQAYLKNQELLENNILRISKKMRPREYKKLSKKLKRLARDIKFNRVELVLEVDYISRLESKNFAFNLNSALSNISDPSTRAVVEGIGVPVLTYFALGNLGLSRMSRLDNVSIYSSHNAGTELTKELGVEFQLPTMKAPKQKKQMIVRITDKDKKVISSKQMTVVTSLNDLAYINSQEMIEASFKKRSLRVGLKYVAAIAAAYVTFREVSKNNGDLLGRAAALTQFLVSAKAISASEEADARHWATLPAFIGQAEFDLPNGSYEVSIGDENTQTVEGQLSAPSFVMLGSLKVDSKSRSLFTYRRF